MKEFKMYADIVYHDSFQEFMGKEKMSVQRILF